MLTLPHRPPEPGLGSRKRFGLDRMACRGGKSSIIQKGVEGGRERTGPDWTRQHSLLEWSGERRSAGSILSPSSAFGGLELEVELEQGQNKERKAREVGGTQTQHHTSKAG